jgi:siroheme synthase-like protein
MNHNNLYPVFLKLHRLNILLVGAGKVGAEKLHSILNNSPESRVTVIGEKISDEVGRIAVKNWNVRLTQRKFQFSDLNHTDIVFLATNDYQLHKSIVKELRGKKILVNVADTPELCDFYLGSIVQKGHLKIGISTDGRSPTVAKRLREYLEDIIPDQINRLISNMNGIRNNLKIEFDEKVKLLNEYTQSLLIEKHNEQYRKN